MLRRLLLVALALGLCAPRIAAADASARATVIRIACVGDSITYGYGLARRETDSYPAVLARLLGPGYEVGNFGVSGATLLRQGSLPYWDQPAFQAATDSGAQIVVLKLGTNDAASRNWLAHGSEFATDAAALVAHFKNLPSKPALWICLPVPVFGPTHTIVEGPRPEIRRILTELAKANGAHVIDAYTPFMFRAEMFRDGLHPDAGGYALLAKTVADALTAPHTATPANTVTR